MEKYQVAGALGFVLAVAGLVPAMMGTTSAGLYALYVLMMAAGVGLMSLSKRMRDAR